MKINKILIFIIFLALPQIAGLIGSFFTIQAINLWYNNINKPSFTPPNYLFGPVWIILYLLMGISSYLIYQEKNEHSPLILKVYLFHLILNSLWSFLFFGLKNPILAFIEIFMLWVIIIYLFISFYKIKKIAGLLLLPYLSWVSFASILNFYIALLN